MFNRKLSRASLGLALSAALGAASLAFAQEPSASSYVRGASRFAAGDFAQATADFDAAIAARSEDPRVYYFRGLCAARQNDPATAAQFYATGARLEIETPKGRLVAVDAALKTIQGAERAPIEAARAKARADWKAKEADRQNALYGESLNRQRARLATPPQTTAASKPAAGEALAFPSIRPFFRGETPAHQAPDPYDPNSDKFNYFREDLGKPASRRANLNVSKNSRNATFTKTRWIVPPPTARLSSIFTTRAKFSSKTRLTPPRTTPTFFTKPTKRTR